VERLENFLSDPEVFRVSAARDLANASYITLSEKIFATCEAIAKAESGARTNSGDTDDKEQLLGHILMLGKFYTVARNRSLFNLRKHASLLHRSQVCKSSDPRADDQRCKAEVFDTHGCICPVGHTPASWQIIRILSRSRGGPQDGFGG